MNTKNISDYDKIVGVSATALVTSGGLTILKQFIEYASQYENTFFYIFINGKIEHQGAHNIEYISVGDLSWVGRIIWDWKRIKTVCEELNIKTVISLQNTSLNVDCEQIIYLHQPLPFSEFKFSPWSLREFKLYLYQRFYKYFIFKYCNDVEFVVQTNWMKESIVCVPSVSGEKVHVIKPDIKLPFLKGTDLAGAKRKSFNLLYPATPLIYKNHYVLVEALSILKSMGAGNLKLIVTFEENEFPQFVELAKKNHVFEMVEFLGVVEYAELCKQYIDCDLLVFPSYVETLGLPLLEAACFGKRIVCSDLPYSRDVLSGYDGVSYVDYKSAQNWADTIMQYLDNDLDLPTPYKIAGSDGWKCFFERFGF